MKFTQDQINRHWRSVYHGHKNLFTPEVLERAQAPGTNYIYELSTGSGMFGDEIYGVTIIEVSAGLATERHDLSQPFIGKDAKKEALKYIESLQ